jgi:hypothetical protein
VALARSNALRVRAEGKALFVVGTHDLVDLGAGERETATSGTGQKLIDGHPPLGVERDVSGRRVVPQHEAQVLADPDCSLPFDHCPNSPAFTIA